jgi:ParB family transcriptional regulator, chromosome partitioning protein
METPAMGAHETDLHRLELRFAPLRLIEPAAVERLARSIERCGQIIPCIAVVEAGAVPWVLVDGYRRIAALRRLGRDTACVQPWTMDLAQALVTVLARAAARPLAAIEEALLLRELVQHLGLSEHEVARRSGRDVSWVSRRLQLVCALPEALLAAVRAGTVSSWAATRVLAPLARANGAHAERLLGALAQAPLSTRELRLWFEQYQQAARLTREHLVDHPRLFVQALAARDSERAVARLRAGAEGEFARDCRHLEVLVDRLRAHLRSLGALVVSEIGTAALARLCDGLGRLHAQLQRSLDDDPGTDPPERADLAGAGPQPAHDQSPAQAVA